MQTLRRYIAPVALLLAALISVQMLDMDRCCEVPPSRHVEAPGLHASDEGAGPHDRSDPAGHDHASSPDCLCHLLFVSTSVAPEVVAPLAPRSSAIEAPESCCSAPQAAPGHVPLA